MMKRNYLGKAMAVVAMLLVGLSFTSCDEKDNALIINGKEWVKSEVIKTDGGATIVANSPSEVSRMLMKVAADLNAAVMAGEDFVIIIDAPSLEASEGDFTVSLPLYNNLSATNDAKVVVNFANSLSTDVPLRIEAKGATGGAITAQNKVEINLPSGTSGIDLDLYMPETSVTLNGGNIDELIAITAPNTLNIESGVTVNWLMTKGGNVAVKDGGKVLGFLGDYYAGLYICEKGLRGSVFKNKVPTTWPCEDDDYYYVQKGKVIKSENGGPVYINIYGSDEEIDTEVDIVITDGAKASIFTDNSSYYPSVNVIGEGDAKIMNEGDKIGGKYKPSGSYLLKGIKNLSNITVDATKVLAWNSETGIFEEVELEEGIDDIDLHLPLNAENCEFITIDEFTDPFWYDSNINDNIVSSTFKNCKFTFKSEDTTGSIMVEMPYQKDDRASFKLIFDTCELDNVNFGTYFKGSGKDYDDFKAYIVLDNSKIDGKAITKDTELISFVDNQYVKDPDTGEDIYTAVTLYIIDGKTYKPIQDPDTYEYSLVPVE